MRPRCLETYSDIQSLVLQACRYCSFLVAFILVVLQQQKCYNKNIFKATKPQIFPIKIQYDLTPPGNTKIDTKRKNKMLLFQPNYLALKKKKKKESFPMNSLTTDVRRRWINRAFVTCSGYIHEQEHTFFFLNLKDLSVQC